MNRSQNKALVSVIHCLPKEVEEINGGLLYFEMYLEFLDDNPCHLKGYMKGPPNSVYKDLYLPIKLIDATDFPQKIPTVSFEFPMFHANIWDDGKICTGSLKGDWEKHDNLKNFQFCRTLFIQYLKESMRYWRVRTLMTLPMAKVAGSITMKSRKILTST